MLFLVDVIADNPAMLTVLYSSGHGFVDVRLSGICCRYGVGRDEVRVRLILETVLTLTHMHALLER